MKNNTTNRGFTLIELLVSVGVFAVVMTLAAGAYFIMIGISRYTQATATAIDGLSFTLEGMTRAIRTGTAYNCGGIGDCPTGTTSFSFLDSKANAVTYSYDGTNHTILRNGIALIDPSVTITSLTFIAEGTSPSDTDQPMLTILISGTVKAGPTKTLPFSIETSTTMRGIDL